MGVKDAALADFKMDEREMPENCLKVEDEEVQVERILNEEEQKKKDEEDRIAEEKKRLGSKDDKRLRGLKDMMNGVLQVRKEDLLKLVCCVLVILKNL